MATQTLLEKTSGSTSQISLPILVYEDANTAIDEGDAVAAAVAAMPASIEGLDPSGEPAFLQLTESVWRVTITYGAATSKYLLQQRRSNYTAQAETRELEWASPVARFPGAAADLKGAIPGGSAVDRPGNVTASVSLEITIASFTAAYRNLIMNAARAGVVNSALIKGYPIGTLQLVSFAANQTSQTKYQCTYGYSYKPAVTGATWGDVTGIAYLGHDLVVPLMEPFVDRNDNVLGERVKAVYVHRPRPSIAFTGLSPSGFDALPDAIA